MTSNSISLCNLFIASIVNDSLAEIHSNFKIKSRPFLCFSLSAKQAAPVSNPNSRVGDASKVFGLFVCFDFYAM